MKLVQVLNEKLRQPTVKEIDDFLTYRANHVALVQRLGKLAFDKDFANHDFDKLTAKGKDFDLMVMRNASKKSDLRLSDEDKNELRKISAKHAKSQKHHAEYWDSDITIRNFDADDKNIIHASRMPYRYIAEMACDWAACALYHNEDIFAWYNKVVDKTLILTDKQKEHLRDCLALIGLIIKKNNIHYPGREYNAKLEEAELDRVHLYADAKGLNAEDLKDYLTGKIRNDWNMDIKKDNSDQNRIRINICAKNGETKPTNQLATEVNKKVQNDKDVTKNIFDTSAKPYTLSAKFEIPDLTFNANFTFKEPESSGQSKDWTPAQERIWCWFICRRINGQSVPKTLEEASAIDWKKEIGMSFSFPLPESWWPSFTRGTELLLPYLDKNKRYIGFREDSCINTINLMNYQFLHEFINNISTKRTDLFSSNDRNLWNPSDIYLIDQGICYSLPRVFSEMARVGSTKYPDLVSINQFFAQHLADKSIVGISLKTLGRGETYYANFKDDNYSEVVERNIYGSVNKELVFRIPALRIDEGLNHKSEASISFSSKEESCPVTFHINGHDSIYTVIAGANSKEGQCAKKTIIDLRSKYSIPDLFRVRSLRELGPYISEIASNKTFKLEAGSQRIENTAFRIAFNKLANQWDDMAQNNRKALLLDAWVDAFTLMLIIIRSYAKGYSELLDTLNTIRHGCEKIGSGCVPFVVIR